MFRIIESIDFSLRLSAFNYKQPSFALFHLCTKKGVVSPLHFENCTIASSLRKGKFKFACLAKFAFRVSHSKAWLSITYFNA
jgi:hypothetical protein